MFCVLKRENRLIAVAMVPLIPVTGHEKRNNWYIPT